MNEEIIKRLKDSLDYEFQLSFKDRKQLLDYITSLQRKNEILRKNAEHNDKVVDKARWNEMIYKSRCKKAMEHIEESLDILKGDSDIPIATGNVRNRYLKPVLNILNGSDENE